MKKAFTILEIIFTLIIISILLVVAIPKLFNNLSNANIIKLKTDLVLIKSAINDYNQKQIYLNTNQLLEVLGNDENQLFNIILDTPIVAQKNIAGNWSKQSLTIYNAWIDNTNSIKFEFDKIKQTFKCDTSKQYCKELLK
ncbi:MAG: hypothetical protein DRG78_12990 [Epsilonproteobacteria bacterium]|nr:MAG: hypothetical protein DRG78_12990 [Campylobacterota bacterium]